MLCTWAPPPVTCSHGCSWSRREAQAWWAFSVGGGVSPSHIYRCCSLISSRSRLFLPLFLATMAHWTKLEAPTLCSHWTKQAQRRGTTAIHWAPCNVGAYGRRAVMLISRPIEEQRVVERAELLSDTGVTGNGFTVSWVLALDPGGQLRSQSKKWQEWMNEFIHSLKSKWMKNQMKKINIGKYLK